MITCMSAGVGVRSQRMMPRWMMPHGLRQIGEAGFQTKAAVPARRARPHQTRNALSAKAGAPVRWAPLTPNANAPSAGAGAPAARAHPHELRQHVVRQLHARPARLLEQVQRGAPGGRAPALPAQLKLRGRRRLLRQLRGFDALRAARGRVCRGARRAPQLWRRAPAGPCGLGLRRGAGRRPGSSRLGATAGAALSAARRAGRQLRCPGRRGVTASRTAAAALPSGAQRLPHAGTACAPACAAGAAPGAASSACAPACAAGAAPGAASSLSASAAPPLASRLRARGVRTRSPTARAAPAFVQAQTRGEACARAARQAEQARGCCASRQACCCSGIGHAWRHRGAMPACMSQAGDRKGPHKRSRTSRHTARAGGKAAGTVPGARGGCGAAPRARARGAHSARRRRRSCVSAARAAEVSSVTLGPRKWPPASFR
jgi:hypothetical protein